MLYILTSHISGRLFSPLRSFVNAVLPQGAEFQFVSKLPWLKSTDVVFGLTNPSTLGLKKMKLDGLTIKEASKFNLRAKLSSPGPIDDIRGTYWRSKKLANAMCCVSWHPKAGLFVYRTLTARWLRIAHKMSEKNSMEAQDGMLHQWKRAETGINVNERLFRSAGLVTFDIETDWNGSFATKITYFSIADQYGSASWVWTEEVRQAVKVWLQQQSPKCAQNFVFDCPWLMKVCELETIQGPLYDTMAMRAEFCRQWPYGLQDIAAQFLIVDPWKTAFREGDLDEILYSAYDSEATYLVAMEMLRLMPSLWGRGLDTYHG